MTFLFNSLWLGWCKVCKVPCPRYAWAWYTWPLDTAWLWLISILPESWLGTEAAAGERWVTRGTTPRSASTSHMLTNQRAASRSCDQCWPIRGQWVTGDCPPGRLYISHPPHHHWPPTAKKILREKITLQEVCVSMSVKTFRGYSKEI